MCVTLLFGSLVKIKFGCAMSANHEYRAYRRVKSEDQSSLPWCPVGLHEVMPETHVATHLACVRFIVAAVPGSNRK